MKRRLKSWHWLALAGCAAAGIALYAEHPELTPVGATAARESERWLATIRKRAQLGYWIVVRGTHPGDQVVAAATAARLTHAVVLDTTADAVIEAVGHGVTVTPLRDLIAESVRVQLLRPRGYDAEKGRIAVARARSHVGARYDWLGTIGLQADRRFYCTELCADAYEARAAGWMPSGVLYPERLQQYGDVLFDSGMRDSTAAAAELAATLGARVAKLLPEVRGVDYAAQVAPGLLRGGMPDDVGVQWLRAKGVRTVIDLREFERDPEAELVRGAGMRYEHIPVGGSALPSVDQVRRFLALVRDPSAQPVYVHCLHGVERTSAMIALYRVQVEGWSKADALAEMARFGAHSVLQDLQPVLDALPTKG